MGPSLCLPLPGKFSRSTPCVDGVPPDPAPQPAPCAMVTPMRTRPYHHNDLSACLAIFDSNLPIYFAPEERPDFASFLRELADEHAYQVIELDGSVVACGGLSPPTNGTAGFCWGMVEKSRHGQGLGRHLARVRLQQAATDPPRGAHCVEHQPAHRGLLRRAGLPRHPTGDGRSRPGNPRRAHGSTPAVDPRHAWMACHALRTQKHPRPKN